jgi:hypothetical protein
VVPRLEAQHTDGTREISRVDGAHIEGSVRQKSSWEDAPFEDGSAERMARNDATDMERCVAVIMKVPGYTRRGRGQDVCATAMASSLRPDVSPVPRFASKWHKGIT